MLSCSILRGTLSNARRMLLVGAVLASSTGLPVTLRAADAPAAKVSFHQQA
jgi:hypothetical protein